MKRISKLSELRMLELDHTKITKDGIEIAELTYLISTASHK